MPNLRPALFVAALALAAAATVSAHTVDEDASWCRSGKGPAIQVNVSGLKDRAGELWLELYPDSETDFLRDDTALVAEGKVFRRIRSHPLAAGDTPMCVRVPHPGRYALLLRHNRTGKDKFSFWSDGVGFPSNQPIGRHRPSFAQARVQAGDGVTVTGVQMQYLHGLRGFQPG